MRAHRLGGVLASLSLLACGRHASKPADADLPAGVTLEVSSPAFSAGGEIPAEYTCDGEDVSPPLAWTGVPAGTRSVAIIVDDPDAPDPAKPTRVWVHMVLAGVPADVTSLARGASTALPPGATLGPSDFGEPTWRGPCPPIGRHRYFFKVYALDAAIDGALAKPDLLARMQGHVLARGELVGTYQKR